MADDPNLPEEFGPNAWLVGELYDQYRQDPSSVSQSWQEFFEDYAPSQNGGGSREVPSGATATATAVPAAPTATAPAATDTKAADTKAAGTKATDTKAAGAKPGQDKAPAAAAAPAAAVGKPAGTPIRGAAARIVANMELSLAVPTATSFRVVPARLLEVNRKVLNNHLSRTRGGKVSFTHIIGYAVVQAVKAMPVMNRTFVPGDPPSVVANEHIGLGLAVDVKKSDGSHTLLVPCIKNADTLDFKAFVAAYEELVRKVKTNKIGPDDFGGVTVSLTNPGTIGTVQSVPRLMPGQGCIVGVGALDYPAEWQAADPRQLAELGVSKVITITSTYDHRVIQGAESGEFLQKIHGLLTGENGFYDGLFRSVAVPYEPVRWRRDVNPVDRERSHLEKQVHVQTLINMYRVRGHLIADLDPLSAKPPHMHDELDPATYGLTIWDLDREFLTDSLASRDVLTLGDILGILRDAYCRTVGVEYMHIQEPDQKRWIQEHVEGVNTQMTPEEQRWILGRLNAAEAFERFLHTKYVGQKRFGLEGGESAIPMIDTILDEAAKAGMSEAVMGMSHRGRLNVL
ncbi:MAG: multifunctional 2-oxoglutarate metabolism enzyme, partial [Acidimicrobiaceae bacterium]|nr:multifunctional 2-oxoglutarate metabolism enzyme [Acidimicrobiaceae bacterium]